MQARDYLSYYATQFDTLEIDATFYRIPARVHGERLVCQDADEFHVSVEGSARNQARPRAGGCRADSERILARDRISRRKARARSCSSFNTSTKKRLPTGGISGAVEAIPGETSTGAALRLGNSQQNVAGSGALRSLAKHNIALALIDHPWMPRPTRLVHKRRCHHHRFHLYPLAGRPQSHRGADENVGQDYRGPFARSAGLGGSLPQLPEAQDRVFAFANNHYPGHAPATLRLFDELMEK